MLVAKMSCQIDNFVARNKSNVNIKTIFYYSLVPIHKMCCSCNGSTVKKNYKICIGQWLWLS